jgi:uncharacterized protein YndB with AHSA1/START domain
MLSVDFTVVHDFSEPVQRVWDEMTDWKKHEAWIPATRIKYDAEDASTVGSTFTGYTGYGPLTLVDRMRVSQIDWDEIARTGTCEVEKLGPVLQGTAGFTVAPTRTGGARVEWFERVTVPYLPSFLSGLVSSLSAAGFSFGLKRLAKHLKANPLPSYRS